MAEVSVDSVVTPAKDELDDENMSKSSAGNRETLSGGRSSDTRPRRASAGSLRRSADKSESANSSQNVVPRYLRASTGSCHDLCKFGHSTETEARKPFRKRIGKPLLAKLSPDQIPVEILVSGGKKKKGVVASVGQTTEEVVLDGNRKDEKKEDVVSGEHKKEEVVLGGQKKDEKKEEVVSGEQKKEEGVLGGQKKDGKKEELVSGGQKKEEVVIHGPSTDTKDQSTDHKPSTDTKSHPTKPKTSLGKEKATKHKPLNTPNVPSPHTTTNLGKPKLSTLTKTYSSKKNDSSGSNTLLSKIKPLSAKRSTSVDPPEIVKSVCFPYTDVADSVKQGSSTDDKISRTEKKATSVAKQKSSPVKLKPVKVKPSSPSDDSDGMHGKARSNSKNARAGRKLMTAKACAKKILAPPSATLSPKLSLKKSVQINSGKPGNLKLVSPLKDHSRIRRVNNKESSSEKVTEKTLHVIAVETRNNVSECIPVDNVITSPQSPLSANSSSLGKNLSSSSQEDNSDSEESAVVMDKVTSKKSDSFGIGKEAPVKENQKKTIRKNRVVAPEDNKHVSPVKVKFRMGKVMELQTDNNSPRRLRFRRARVLGVEEIKGDSRKKTSKKTAINTGSASTGNTSQKVVLKHQNVQGKKDAQGLLNNVIEETASKLAESRKSKVKALVGAFETVISLQESKPSTQVVS